MAIALAALDGAGPTIDVTRAAEVIGVSRATLYAAIKEGTAPVKVIRVGGRIKVVTASVRVLFEDGRDVRIGETAREKPRPESGSAGLTGSAVKHDPSGFSGGEVRTGVA